MEWKRERERERLRHGCWDMQHSTQQNSQKRSNSLGDDSTKFLKKKLKFFAFFDQYFVLNWNICKKVGSVS